ncbi:hypothetical protein ACFYYY_25405 [Streptomyces sp. NPDC001834]|uniref:hypothetical protein n=1 Tax=unclassified Streptomyces TaxID=2593676 RepID=UPI00341FF803
MNTFLNIMGISALIGLFLLLTLFGLARERRIEHDLQEAERAGAQAPPETADAVRPVTAARRPHLRSWARI